MSKKKKDISEAVTLESMDENIVVADTEAEGEPSVSEEKEEKKKDSFAKKSQTYTYFVPLLPFSYY
mgnify:CR=1 FL=1